MLKILQISNWNKHFEVNRTRELKSMSWVPVPNKHDGDGYTDLISRPNGMILFAGWILILETASKCEPRGTLLRDSGIPHNARSIARLTRGDEAGIQSAIDVCLEIGWIEYKYIENTEVTTVPHDGAEIPHEGVTIRREGREGREEKTNTEIPPLADGAVFSEPDADADFQQEEPDFPPMFDTFWAAYPKCDRKTDKKKCKAIWEKRELDTLAPAIIAGLEAWKRSEQWTKSKGQFIPLVTTWLNNDRWEEPPSPSPKAEDDEQIARECGIVPDAYPSDELLKWTAEQIAAQGEIQNGGL